MTNERYLAIIKEKSDAEYQKRWTTLSKDLRELGAELRSEDAALTFIMQGLAVQIDKMLLHINKRQAEIERAVQILADAEPIESTPTLETDPKPDLLN